VVTQVFEPDEMVPAPGQGALAVECLDRDPGLVDLLACVDNPASRAAVTAERSLLAALQAGCSAPVGAYAAGTEMLQLRAVVAGADGGSAIRASASAPVGEAGRLGGEVAAELLRRGAGRYLAMSLEDLSSGEDTQ
jgi:hydroxymethylbilane synthase